jgi:hypothetical protein
LSDPKPETITQFDFTVKMSPIDKIAKFSFAQTAKATVYIPSDRES